MEQLLDWLLKLRNTSFQDNARFYDLTKYKNFSFWGTLRYRMFYDIQTSIKTNRRLYPPNSLQRFIGRFSYLFVLYFFIVSVVSKILCFLVRVKETEKEYSLFATTDFPSMRVLTTPGSRESEFGHSIFHFIFKKISRNYPNIRILSGYPFGFTLRRNIRLALNMRRSGVVGIFNPLESYASIGSLLEIIRAKQHFSKMLNRLKDEAIQTDFLSFNKINLLSELPNYFEYYFHTFLPLAALNFNLCQQLLRKELPNIILIVDEYLLFGRSLLFAAAEKQIPTLAIQHGVIPASHPGYIYGKDEIAQDGNPFFPYSPIPTKTALYGKYYERILTQYSAYPKSRLIVTGQPRYDILELANEIYSKEEFCRRYDLDSAKKITLLITQPFPIQMARKEFVIPTTQALTQIPKLQIVVKPHPSESADWYIDLLARQGIEATILSPKSDTVEALAVSDFVIAVNSTTIIEALLLNKPVVVVNLSNFPEILPWVSDGAAIEVTNPDELLATFQKVLDERPLLQTLSEGRQRFLRDQIYKNDGKATDRVITTLLSLVRSSESNSSAPD